MLLINAGSSFTNNLFPDTSTVRPTLCFRPLSGGSTRFVVVRQLAAIPPEPPQNLPPNAFAFHLPASPPGCTLLTAIDTAKQTIFDTLRTVLLSLMVE